MLAGRDVFERLPHRVFETDRGAAAIDAEIAADEIAAVRRRCGGCYNGLWFVHAAHGVGGGMENIRSDVRQANVAEAVP